MTKVVDVWASWCGPCKRFAPIFAQVATEFPNVQFIKVNADIDEEFLNEHKISSIPTVVILDDNDEIMFSHVGILTAEALRSVVRTYE
jgi:thioredoxin